MPCFGAVYRWAHAARNHHAPQASIAPPSARGPGAVSLLLSSGHPRGTSGCGMDAGSGRWELPSSQPLLTRACPPRPLGKTPSGLLPACVALSPSCADLWVPFLPRTGPCHAVSCWALALRGLRCTKASTPPVSPVAPAFCVWFENLVSCPGQWPSLRSSRKERGPVCLTGASLTPSL